MANKSVLLIEDEDTLAEMYTEKLEREGFAVTHAPNSERGIELAQKHHPDIVLLDILLQNENGLSFLWKKQDINDIRDIPVIAFSNYEDQATRKEALKLGAKEYLLKTDYTPHDIVEKLKEYTTQKEV